MNSGPRGQPATTAGEASGFALKFKLIKLASPLFVAQIALMMQGIIDTLMA